MSGPAPDAAPSLPRNPALTVDAAVFCVSGTGGGGETLVLLIERGREPGKGRFALPGGFVDYGEDPDRAVERELAEETGLTDIILRQFRTYGRPDRDPRGHTVSVVYCGEVQGSPPSVRGGDDAAAAAWVPVSELPPLAFDHERILGDIARARRAR